MCHLTSTVLFLSALSLLFHLSFAQNSEEQRCKDPLPTCDPGQSLFPAENQVEIKYAKATIPEISYFNTYVDFTVSFVDTSDGNAVSLDYRLVACGCTAPEDTPDRTVVIYTNPENVFVQETPALYMINWTLASLDPVYYVGKFENIYNPTVRELANTDPPRIVEVSPSGNVDFTRFEKDRPVSMAFSTAFGFEKMRSDFQEGVGRPVLPIAEVGEVSPLARAEWLKLVALIFNEARKGNELFNNVVDTYNDAKAKARFATRRPSVFFNYPFENSWVQPGSNQYISELIRDANADYRYAYKGESDSSNMLTVEKVLEEFRSARFLLNSDPFPFLNVSTLENYTAQIKTDTGSYGKNLETLEAVQCSRVWGRSQRRTENLRSTDFFESAIARPDLVLLDYIKILHPDLNIGDHQLFYISQYIPVDPQSFSCPYISLINKPDEGEVYVDKQLIVEGMNRFEVQDKLVDEVYPRLKEKRITKDMVDVQFRDKQTENEENANFTVRLLVREEDAEDTRESSDVADAFREALDVPVREIGASTEDLEPKTSGSSLSAGAIVAIVVLVFAVIVLFVFVIKAKVSQTSPLSAYGSLPSPMGEGHDNDYATGDDHISTDSQA